ncbi:MAG: cyclase family protein [Candidatus Hodarchaeota archaeon]
MKIYDVSMLIHEKMIAYPGNPPPMIEKLSEIPRSSVNASSICLGSHAGTHVDSPLHVKENGKSATSLPLDSFYGPCRVLDLTSVNLEIHAEDLEEFDIKEGEIILLKTKNSLRGFDKFRKDYIHVKIDAAEYLVKKGIKTLGVDYLSVKKFGGDDEVHEKTIMNMTLFEGLDLSEPPAGKYVFAGLPLRIDCDGAPARVLLIKE